MSGEYVYFVYRDVRDGIEFLSDTIGKIGKGTGDRYKKHTPAFGSDTIILVWYCQNAEAKEGDILNILRPFGYIRQAHEDNECLSIESEGNDIANAKLYMRVCDGIVRLISTCVGSLPECKRGENYHKNIDPMEGYFLVGDYEIILDSGKDFKIESKQKIDRQYWTL